MTYYQASLAQLSNLFSPANVGGVNLDVLAPGRTLLEVADGLKLALTDVERAYIDNIPPGLQEAVRAVLRSAIDRPTRLAVTFGGVPDRFFHVRIFETSGGMSIILHGPVPDTYSQALA